MSNLTDQLKNSNGRTTALENDRLNIKKELSRITKSYGNLTVTVTVKYNKHLYQVCGAPNVIVGSPNCIL